MLNRQSRFLIDDPDVTNKLAYELTKPVKRGSVYDGHGTFIFVLKEASETEYDNDELGIADYYRHFPEEKAAHAGVQPGSQDGADTERKVWI